MNPFSELGRSRPTLVLGDVHLHEQSSECLAADLARLLEKWAERPFSGPESRPCILLNGDFFDLDRVLEDADGGVSAASASSRLQKILCHFENVTSAFRKAIQKGFEVIFVVGNHDAQLHLPLVQIKLREILGATEEQLQVCEILESPFLWVAHGHQVDPDSCFFPDTETAVSKERLSVYPLACLMTRLYLSKLPRFELQRDNYLRPLQVLWRILRDYKLAALAMILRFPWTGTQIVVQSCLACKRGDVPRKMRWACTMSSPWEVAKRLYLDRYFTTVIALILLLGMLLGGYQSGLGWAFLAAAIMLAIPPSRRKRFALRDVRYAERWAREKAEGGRILILAHTHRAFISSLEEAVYANAGAFSNRGPEGRSFLVLDRGCCELRYWVEEGAPRCRPKVLQTPFFGTALPEMTIHRPSELIGTTKNDDTCPLKANRD